MFRTLAVIPARGGSKSVPRKNIQPLCGRPLLAYTLDAAKAAARFDMIAVSTDDPDIASVAQDAGVACVQRPAALATDTATTESAVLHAIDTLEAGGQPFTHVGILEPTSPLRRPGTVAGAFDAFVNSGAPSMLTVVETRGNFGWRREGLFVPVMPGAPRRRQDREPLFKEAGVLYACRVDHLRATGCLPCEAWFAVVVDEEEALDINGPIDFLIAEAIIANRGKEGRT